MLAMLSNLKKNVNATGTEMKDIKKNQMQLLELKNT